MDPATMALIASVAAGGLGALGNIFGSKNKTSKLPTKTKLQTAFQNNLIQQALGMQGAGGGYSDALNLLQQYLNPSSQATQNFAYPYMQEFQEQTIPRLAERFAGFGPTSGALSSSGFAQALGGAGAGLQAKLAGLKAALGQQGASSLMNQFNSLAGLGLNTDQFAYANKPGSGGVLGGLGAGAAQSLPLLLQMMMMGQGGSQSSAQSSMGMSGPLTSNQAGIGSAQLPGFNPNLGMASSPYLF